MDSQIETVVIFDSFGREVNIPGTNTSSEVQLSGLSNGIYFIRVRFMNGTIGTTKVLKTK